jgi:hypothetical protein
MHNTQFREQEFISHFAATRSEWGKNAYPVEYIDHQRDSDDCLREIEQHFTTGVMSGNLTHVADFSLDRSKEFDKLAHNSDVRHQEQV